VQRPAVAIFKHFRRVVQQVSTVRLLKTQAMRSEELYMFNVRFEFLHIRTVVSQSPNAHLLQRMKPLILQAFQILVYVFQQSQARASISSRSDPRRLLSTL
jgi:hypothetical protein